jgi:hypothetical protein
MSKSFVPFFSHQWMPQAAKLSQLVALLSPADCMFMMK